MDQEKDLSQLSDDMKYLDDENPIPQMQDLCEGIEGSGSEFDAVTVESPDEPEDYEQLRYGAPQYPNPRTQNGSNYVPLSRENVYAPTAYSPSNGNSVPNGYSAPNGTRIPYGYSAPNGSYASNGSYGLNRNYAPDGSYDPMRSYAPNRNYVPNGSNAPYGTSMLPMPVAKKNRKPIFSLIFGLLAMGVLNFFPFIALCMGVIALCTGYIGLKKGELTTGERVCGLIGLALGIISLIISVSMLVILLSLSIKVSRIAADAQGSIYR